MEVRYRYPGKGDLDVSPLPDPRTEPVGVCRSLRPKSTSAAPPLRPRGHLSTPNHRQPHTHVHGHFTDLVRPPVACGRLSFVTGDPSPVLLPVGMRVDAGPPPTCSEGWSTARVVPTTCLSSLTRSG